MKNQSVVIFILSFVSVNASPETLIEVSEDDECPYIIEENGRPFFNNYIKEAENVVNNLCESNFSKDNYNRTMLSEAIGDLEVMIGVGREELIEALGQTFPTKQFDEFEQEAVSELSAPSISMFYEDGTIGFYYGNSQVAIDDEEACNSAIARNLGVDRDSNEYPSLCFDLIDKFTFIYSTTVARTNVHSLLETKEYQKDIAAQWEDFRTETKPQTPWEMAINGRAFQSKYGRFFLPPPSFQWVVMHPNAAFENVPASTDGNQFQEAIILEIVGVDYWNQDKWWLPTGVSATAIYSDRPESSDIRWGVGFNFSNSIVIGPSVHGGDFGYFMTIDLIELLSDRQDLLDKIGAPELPAH